MARPPSGSGPDRRNYVSEWFGHRVYPVVVSTPASVKDQTDEACPFLTAATGRNWGCVKSAAARGVCSINTLTNGARRDWLVCPYRALDLRLLEAAVRRLFLFPSEQSVLMFPAIQLASEEMRLKVADRLTAGERVLIYFDDKLGGELSIPPTAKSPEFSFDITVIEIELLKGESHIGRFGVIEIQTMDFHGSYRKAVDNVKHGLRLHPNDFGKVLQDNQRWLAEAIEGPNIANVFKRTFYQMMFKFQLAQSERCAGCVLAVPISVWDSWQRHLGQPELEQEPDGTFSLFRNDRPRPKQAPAWIYAFDLDASVPVTPSPIILAKIIATDAPSLSHFALDVAPLAAIENIVSQTGLFGLLARRLKDLWPALGETIQIN